MASLMDSVIDQFGNAVPNATVTLFTYPVKAQVAVKTTDGNGFFYFPNLADGKYSLEIRSASLTTRVVDDIDVVDAQLVSAGNDGLMLASDKAKLDAMPQVPDLNYLSDVTISNVAVNDILIYSQSQWRNITYGSLPFIGTASLTHTGGTDEQANKVPQLGGAGLLDLSFLPVTPVGGLVRPAWIPQLNASGYLDPTLLPVTLNGGVGVSNKVPQLNGAGVLNNNLLNVATAGGAASAAKVVQLDANGKLDPSMLPTAGGTFQGNLDLTIAYVAPSPAWKASDYGAVAVTGPVHSSWVPYLAAPVPTSVKQGDNLIYNGTLYSYTPSTVDTSIYLMLDGSKAMTGPLTLKAQTGGGAIVPTGQQAVGLAFADIRYTKVVVAGDGGTVTQITDKSTPVSLNKVCGQIVTSNGLTKSPAMAGPRPVAFTFSNSFIGANDTVLVSHKSGGTAMAYNVWVDSVAAGVCVICIANMSGVDLSQVLTLSFTVVKGVIA